MVSQSSNDVMEFEENDRKCVVFKITDTFGLVAGYAIRYLEKNKFVMDETYEGKSLEYVERLARQYTMKQRNISDEWSVKENDD